MGNNIEYGMVDLGLPSGLKWADRNVGAEKTEAYGDYFMWGSTTPDTDNVCDWAHTPFNGGHGDYDEEYFIANSGTWMNADFTLKPEYDAAHAIMGGNWRMPTSAEIRELIDGTTQTVERLNGIAGMRFTSNANGNSIFMPFAGHRNDSKVISVDYLGYVWSSSLHAIYTFDSQYLNFRSNGLVHVYRCYRCNGFAVRGVFQ